MEKTGVSDFDYDKTDIYYKTDGICVICGKPVGHTRPWSLEHYIPRAIYKWVFDPILAQKIESFANLFIVHPACNFHKDSALPTTHRIQAMHAPLPVIREVETLYEDIKPFVVRYRVLKQRIWESQQKQCYFCHKTLTFSQAILRRKHTDKPRTEHNAMCLCSKCSRNLGSPKQLISTVIVVKNKKPILVDWLFWQIG